MTLTEGSSPVAWFKSSHSQSEAACVEVAHIPAPFKKASYSADQTACVEVADWATGAAVRDTKHRNLGALVFPSAEWCAFIDAAKRGSF